MPSHLPEELPLSGLSRVSRPGQEPLPTGQRVRVASCDPGEPLSLPVLATPAPERGTLEDPTLEASQAAALAPASTGQTQPASFLLLTVPDPFEHREAVRLRRPLDEDPTPATGPVQPPR